jgi:hypothetical protein
MSYPGGIAAKHGERYETRWTVYCVLDMLRGKADSIDLEPIGVEGDGAEFVLVRGDRREYHQVKRRNTGKGHWSLTALRAEGVLDAFSRKLQAGGFARFISEQDADQLRVLAERARDARDLDDFRKRLGGETWTQPFRTLTSHMGLSEADTFDALLRLEITVVDEEKLKSLNEAWVEPLIDGQPADVLAALADLVRDAIPGRLDAAGVWKVLSENYGKGRRQWNLDQTLRERVDELNDSFLAPLRGVRLQHPLDRAQVSEAHALLEREDLDGILLTGSAGSGKSDVALKVIDDLVADSWNLLWLRADRLDPARTPTEIGEQLGLPGSPVGVLAALAEGKRSLLVIDQLDAVSVASGRVTGLWEALYALICQARAMTGMRVLIACRQFDVDNDHRMRALTSEEHKLTVLPVPPLDASQVDEAVSAMGLDAATLTERKRSLLGVPLHLILLEAIASESDALDFSTITDLFDRFWRRKQRDADEHAGRPVKWAAVVETATSYMSDYLRLSVPAAQFDRDGLLSDADALQSENVLVNDDGAYRFFHESFFDYAFARLYLSSGKTIRDLLAAGDQDLFRRAQVRQLLTQQRDSDHPAYVRALADLLNGEDIRFHLKQLILAWLTATADAHTEEVEILARVLRESDPSDPRRPLVWRVFAQPAWFDLAVSRGLVAEWLADADSTITNILVQVLGTIVNERTDVVLELLRTHDDGGSEWRDRIAYVVRFGDVQNSRGLFEMLLNVLNRDAFLATADHDAWLYGRELPQEEPAWAAELMGALLQRASARAKRDGHPHALHNGAPLQHEYSAIEFVTTLADTDPAALLSAALPFVLETIDGDLETEGEHDEESGRLPVARVWAYRLSNEIDTFDQALLAAVCNALGQLAQTDPPAFKEWATSLRERRDETSQFILYQGLQGNPTEFADFAAQILLDGTWRYWTADAENPFWATHQLLETIAPHLSLERLNELETAILGFTTRYERTAHGHRARGEAEFQLLSALQAAQMSAPARKRLQELQRKFQTEKPPAPVGIIGGAVGSPISVESARRMTDEDWLNAIAKHTERWEDKRSMDLIGGAAELASVLQTVAQEQAERFARLGLNFPQDTLETYVEHLLIGLAQPDGDTPPASLESIVALSRHVAHWSDTPSARWLPRLLAKYAEETIPEDLMKLVVQIATENPDPREDVWKIDAGGGQPYYGGDILGAGMNSARGAAALAIADLVVVDEGRVALLGPAIKKICADPLASVKACAAQAVYALMRWRRDEAVDDLLVLADGPDRLLATPPMQHLIMGAIATHWKLARPTVERMLASDESDARDAGGALASIAGLDESDANDLLTRVLDSDDSSVRKGAAKVLAARAVSSRYRERCATGLERLFDDSDPEIRQEAAKVFWRLQDRQLGELDHLAHAFLASAAFRGNHQHFLRALEVSTTDVVDLVLATADHMVTSYGAQLGDLQSRIGGDARHLSDLLLRVLGTLDGDREKINRALDILDLMLEAGAWGVTEALDTVER